MKWIARLAPIALLAACGGAPTFYQSAAIGPAVNLIDCAADAITDEGFTITDRNDEVGLLDAAYGTGFDDAEDAETWLHVQVVQDGRGYHVIEVETSDDDIARESAMEIMTECGT